jgi:hypothetical protein
MRRADLLANAERPADERPRPIAPVLPDREPPPPPPYERCVACGAIHRGVTAGIDCLRAEVMRQRLLIYELRRALATWRPAT